MATTITTIIIMNDGYNNINNNNNNDAMQWCPQVGKKIWQEVLAGKDYELFVAPQKFSESVDPALMPPYR
jgi:hypothetical protein